MRLICIDEIGWHISKSRLHVCTHLPRPRVYLTRVSRSRLQDITFRLRDPISPPFQLVQYNSRVSGPKGMQSFISPDKLSGRPKIAAHFAILTPALDVRLDVTDGQLKCYNLPPVKCLALTECAAVYCNEGTFFLYTHNSTVLSASYLSSIDVKKKSN